MSLPGCVSTQVIQPGGETAKVRGGASGPLDRAGLRGPIFHPFKSSLARPVAVLLVVFYTLSLWGY